MTDVREQVRERYASAARGVVDESCCGGSSGPAVFGIGLYDATDLVGIPRGSQDVSLGCGTPLTVADLREGDGDHGDGREEACRTSSYVHEDP